MKKQSAISDILPHPTPNGLSILSSDDLRIPDGYMPRYTLVPIGAYLPEGVNGISGNELASKLRHASVFPCDLAHGVDQYRKTNGFGGKTVFLFGSTFTENTDKKTPKDPVVLQLASAGGGIMGYYPRSLEAQFAAGEYVLLVEFLPKE